MKRFLSYLTTLFAVAFLAACGGGGGSAGGNPNAPAFFTTAPGDLTLTLGQAQSFLVGGGRAPYTVSSGNAAVVVGVLNGNTLTLGGARPGATSVTVRDAIGEVRTVSVTVAPAQALSTTAPGSVTLPIGAAGTQVYQISGGVGPYTVASSAPAIVAASLSGNNLLLTGLVGGAGSVTIRDAVGSTLNVSVSVAPAEPLFSSASPSVSVANGTSATYTVGGGTAPYTVSSSNSVVATAALVNGSLVITGKAPGNATVTVRDAGGQTVNAQVTVVVPTAFYTTAPTAVTVAIGGNASFTVGGGVTPYTATSSNQNVATATLNNGTLTINGISAGTATILLRDSNNASISLAVTVPTASTVALFTTAPASVSLSVGAGAAQSYSIGGGSGGYTVTSSNTSVVRVSGTNPFTLTGVAPGTANVVIRDNAGNTVTVAVAVQTNALRLNPTEATSLVGLPNYATIIGGVGPYTVVSGFPTAVNASIGRLNTTTGEFTADTNGDILRMVANIAVDPAQIIVTDSVGNSANFSLKASPGSPSFGIGPSALTVSTCANPATPINMLIFGAQTGSTALFSSDTNLVAVPATVATTVTGSTQFNLQLTSNVRNLAGSAQVLITAVDPTGAVATSIVTLEKSVLACP
jgi:hypothetical protein